MATKRKPAKRTIKNKSSGFKYWGETFGIVLILVALLFAGSLITHNADDLNVSDKPIENKLGWVGAQISQGLMLFLGFISFLVPLFLILWGYYQLRGGLDLIRGLRLLTALALILLLSALFAFSVLGDDPGSIERSMLRGGAIGLMLKDYISFVLGHWGGIVLVVTLLIVATAYVFDFNLIGLMKVTARGLRWLWDKLSQLVGDTVFTEAQKRRIRKETESRTRHEEKISEDAVDKMPTEETSKPEKPKVKKDKKTPAKDPEIPPLPYLPDDGLYKLPPIELLKPHDPGDFEVDKDWLLLMQRTLNDALDDYGVAASVLEILPPGPRVTRFELKMEPGEKVSSIRKLEQELAIALSVSHVTIIATPGKGTVSVDVPNPMSSRVSMREVLSDDDVRKPIEQAALPLLFGRRSDGLPLVADLAKMPHLLIAGTTGSGKSVFLNSVILGMIMNRTPKQVQFLVVDPKRVDLVSFADIPHRFRFKEIITDVDDAIAVLRYAVKRMEGRYKLLGHFGVRNIEGYNELFTTKDGEKRLIDATDESIDEEQGYPLPYIVIIIDELGDLMMQESRKVEEHMVRLAQMARAVGIHLVVATQRPSVDVITGVIKANFPSRVAFKVMSKTDSRTIIDTSGAETLLKEGDMLFYPVGASEPSRVQGVFVDDEEIKRVVDFLKKQPPPKPLVSIKDGEAANDIPDFADSGDADEDELYDEAVRTVVLAGQASQSMLQRKLRVGFARAGRLIDIMETRGVVGPPVGTKARDVLISPEDLE
ncbi:MAG: hypothetical protein GY771_11025 [bacterium]|nr:hypothetical protein [bacterium]